MPGRTLTGQATYGNALSVTGASSQYARRAVVSTVTNNFTMSCWVKITSYGAGNTFIFQNGANDANGMALYITNAGVLHGDISFVADVNSAFTLNTATWYHIAWIRNGGTSQLYVNAVAKGSTSASTPNSPGSWTTIGAWANAAGTVSGYFTGLIDDVRFYERAISTTELTNMYNKGLDASLNDIDTSNLKLWLKLDESSGTSCSDSSGNSNTLTTSGTPTFTTGVVQISNIPARSSASSRTAAGTRTLAT